MFVWAECWEKKFIITPIEKFINNSGHKLQTKNNIFMATDCVFAAMVA